MKVAITGANGLIGKKLIVELNKLSVEYIALTRRCVCDLGLNFVQTDYSVTSLSGIFKEIDIVIHLAANRGSGAFVYEEYQKNENLTEDVLKAMVCANCKRIIYISSISVYSDTDLLPWKEDQHVIPVSFYGLSKLACEYLCQLYVSKGIEFTILRCAHVLGIEKRGYMLSRFMEAAYAHKSLCVKGKSIAHREFIYVKDVANAICWAVNNTSTCNQVFNLGYGIGYTNYEIAVLINTAFRNSEQINYEDELSEGIVDSYMDVNKLKSAGFVPTYSIETAMDDLFNEYNLIQRN